MYNNVDNVNSEDLANEVTLTKLVNNEVVSQQERTALESNIGGVKLEAILARREDVKDLIELGFRAKTIINRDTSIEKLSCLLDNKQQVSSVLTLILRMI